MKTRLFTHVVFFLICIGSTAYAQDVTISAGTDKQEYLIGDYIRLNIVVNATPDALLQMPLIDSIAPQYEIINITAIDTLHEQNKIELKQQVVYSIYDSGIYKIDPVRIQYKLKNDAEMYFASSDTIRFMVNTIPVDTAQQIKPIKTILDVQVKNYTLLFILLSLFVLCWVIYGFILGIKSTGKLLAAPVKVYHTPQSLYENTKQRLATLQEKKLWQQDKTKEYYVELTDVLRSYIETRYMLPAMESTSDEIIELLVHAGVTGEQIQHMNAILLSADFAKFAKSKPLPEENILAMQYANEFVEQTKAIENNSVKTL